MTTCSSMAREFPPSHVADPVAPERSFPLFAEQPPGWAQDPGRSSPRRGGQLPSPAGGLKASTALSARGSHMRADISDSFRGRSRARPVGCRLLDSINRWKTRIAVSRLLSHATMPPARRRCSNILCAARSSALSSPRRISPRLAQRLFGRAADAIARPLRSIGGGNAPADTGSQGSRSSCWSSACNRAINRRVAGQDDGPVQTRTARWRRRTNIVASISGQA